MLTRFAAHLRTLDLAPGSRGLVAVSGGPDSIALLDLLVATTSSHRLSIVVGHVDHGIHPESASVADQVESLAASYGLEYRASRLRMGPGTSETEARRARYAALEAMRLAEHADYVITAHHADDQVETVLLRVLHGSGPAGLAAMAARREHLLRPLLPFRRSELAQYLSDRGLPSWEDPANRDPAHLRSWLRGSVLPRIRDRIPEVDEHLLRLAAQAATERQSWDQIIELLPGLAWREEPAGGSVAVATLAGYDSTLGTTLLRAVARRVGCQLGSDQSERAFEFVRRARSGSRFEIGNRWTLEVVFDRVQLINTPDSVAEPTLILGAGEGSERWGRWSLSWRLESTPEQQPRDGFTAWFIPEPLRVRPWAAGDKVRPLRGTGSRLVVKCFQESRIPRYLRESWPLMIAPAGEVAWIPGVCRSDHLVPPPGAEALRVDAQIT